MLIYGMGEKPICELVRRLTTHNEYRDSTTSPFNICRSSLTTIPQIAYLTDEYEPDEQDIALHSHEECLADKRSSPPTSGTLKKKAINMQQPGLFKL